MQSPRVENILDDEFVIQLDDSPPFNWIRQTPNRFMSCDVRKKFNSITVHAAGSAFLISKMVSDLVGEKNLKVESSFLSMNEETDVIITYSGELRKAIMLIERSEKKGVVMASGGVIKNIARNRAWDYISLPKGYPTRFLFPEIFGCLLSLLGRKIETSDLESFIDSVMPSSVTENNLAKQFAYRMAEGNIVLFYDYESGGLANRLKDSLSTNAGVDCETYRVDQHDQAENQINPETVAIYVTKKIGPSKGKGSIMLPFDCGSVNGYIKNVLIVDLASLYLGFLRRKEIEFLDRSLE